MEQTLYKGDVVLVKKYITGARLSESYGDIPLITLFKKWIGRTNHGIDFRMPSSGEVKQDDIVVFNHPQQRNKKLVKRCTGLPGDTIQIKHNLRSINGKILKDPSEVRYSYLLHVNNSDELKGTLVKYNVYPDGYLWQEDLGIHYTLSKEEAGRLEQAECIDSVTIDDFPQGSFGPMLFPGPGYVYTRENYGPVVIPGKGLTLSLDSSNYDIYKDAIVYEHNTIALQDGVIYINNKEAADYTFNHNYYFMMGDNRYQSIDSRYWGFVPDDCIIGIACHLF